MLFSLIFDRFAKRAPISVMVRAALEYALDPIERAIFIRAILDGIDCVSQLRDRSAQLVPVLQLKSGAPEVAALVVSWPLDQEVVRQLRIVNCRVRRNPHRVPIIGRHLHDGATPMQRYSSAAGFRVPFTVLVGESPALTSFRPAKSVTARGETDLGKRHRARANCGRIGNRTGRFTQTGGANRQIIGRPGPAAERPREENDAALGVTLIGARFTSGAARSSWNLTDDLDDLLH